MNIKIPGLTADIDLKTRELTIWDTRLGERLIIASLANLLRPTMDGVPVETKFLGVKQRGRRIRFLYEGQGLKQGEVRLEAKDGHFEWSARFTVEKACQLNRLDLLPPGTHLNMFDVVNFRNRHFSPHTYPELNLGGKGMETDTYSTDWQFAPHPTMMILRKQDRHLLVGALDLPKAFGMYLKVADYKVKEWHLDFGDVGSGLPLGKGETFSSPRFSIIPAWNETAHKTIGRWTDLLVREGAIPSPRQRRPIAWHRENLYCTWIDQWAHSECELPAELKDQAEGGSPIEQAFNEDLVREALALIRREKLPFGIFLIDAGWSVVRGQWEADPVRFPNFRRLVDDIHAAGMKVMAWWAWPEITPPAQVNPAYLVGEGRLNRHGMRMWDFSYPRTQREWLRPLMRRMLSSSPGCYDLDGIKTDFTADKIHADMPLHNPDWRGEENYFFHLYRLLRAEMLRQKPDACHMGCAGHPFLAAFMDLNRTFDVHSSDYREHENRALMLEATAPGCPVSLDFHLFTERLAGFFELAKRRGYAIQIGNVLRTRRDACAGWKPADANDHRQLRRLFREATNRSGTEAAR